MNYNIYGSGSKKLLTVINGLVGHFITLSKPGRALNALPVIFENEFSKNN